MTEPAMTPDDPFGQLRWDLADRLNKALRIGECKPGEMAAILGVSPGTITNYLKGSTTPKDGMLRQWGVRCRVPWRWIKTGIEQSEPDGGADLPGRTSPWEPNVLPFKAREDRHPIPPPSQLAPAA